ncbi:hypothetical protein BJV82DRAFT_97191 [Fennellomyces sp. T-0311]|nr:hypothetical protein BJV82DRAFT_97191 [Fennellomyces sp. T-0311]
MRTAPSRFRSQEMLQELFEEINDYLGDKPSETGQVCPSLTQNSKTAVEPAEPPKPRKHYAPPSQPFLVESDESDDESHLRYTTSPQDLRPQCLLTCPITEEKPSVCMCYKCNKQKSDEQHRSPPRKAQQSRRAWTPTNALGFGGIADKVKQTFIRPQQQQQHENYSGYEAQPKRPSSRGARRRWIPRPKSLPSLSFYIQKQEESEARHSWNANRHKHRASMYEDYGDKFDDRRSSTLYESIVEDGVIKQDFMDSSYHHNDGQEQPSSSQLQYRTDYKEQTSSSQSQYPTDYQEPQSSQPQYRNDFYQPQPATAQLHGYRMDHQEQASSQQQFRSNFQESPSATLQAEYHHQEPQTVPSQQEPVLQTPLPGFADVPYLTPSTRIGEEHYPLSMKESRALPTKEERMTAYRGPCRQCILSLHHGQIRLDSMAYETIQ